MELSPTALGWTDVLHYLKVLADSGLVIVAGSRDVRAPSGPLSQQRGYLGSPREHRFVEFKPSPIGYLCPLHWPKPDDHAGYVTIYEHLFETATLSTVDGDDYFWLNVILGPTEVFFEDSARN